MFPLHGRSSQVDEKPAQAAPKATRKRRIPCGMEWISRMLKPWSWVPMQLGLNDFELDMFKPFAYPANMCFFSWKQKTWETWCFVSFKKVIYKVILKRPNILMVYTVYTALLKLRKSCDGGPCKPRHRRPQGQSSGIVIRQISGSEVGRSGEICWKWEETWLETWLENTRTRNLTRKY